MAFIGFRITSFDLICRRQHQHLGISYNDSSLLESFAQVLKLLDGHVDWKVENIDGKSVQGFGSIVKTWKRP